MAGAKHGNLRQAIGELAAGVPDGALTESGRLQAVVRIYQMDIEEVLYMLRADMVLVSPVKRAMQTALTLFVMALKRVTEQAPERLPVFQFPTFQIMPDLREKVESASDKPGVHGVSFWSKEYNPFEEEGEEPDTMTGTLHHLENTCSEAEPGHRDMLRQALHDAFEGIRGSWLETMNPRPPHSTNWAEYMSQVAQFRHALTQVRLPESHWDSERAGQPPRTTIIVGHSGWARFAFAAFLPAAAPPINLEHGGADHVQPNESVLALGGRFVHGLNNCGIVKCIFEWADGMPGHFTTADRQALAIDGGGGVRGNFNEVPNHRMPGIVHAPAEVLDQIAFPRNSEHYPTLTNFHPKLDFGPTEDFASFELAGVLPAHRVYLDQIPVKK